MICITGDTNFWVSATIWPNSVCNKLLKAIIEHSIDIYASNEILEEYAKVMRRDFNLTFEIIEMRIRSIRENTDIVVPNEKLDIVHDDPSDNKILECAVASNSDYIITYDKHILAIKEFRGIKIITPEIMLKAIESKTIK
jgi:putative PIN family toxin of toxin-antitoxin system